MHATCGMLYMSSCCTCHHVAHVIMLYMSSCCTCHHVVHVIMLYMSCCTVIMLYMSSCCTCHVVQSSCCTCHVVHVMLYMSLCCTVIMLYMSCCTCHHVVHVIMLYRSSCCTCVKVRCAYLQVTILYSRFSYRPSDEGARSKKLKKRREILSRTDRANEVNKEFIIWLLVYFE